jgi:hypothetical protein
MESASKDVLPAVKACIENAERLNDHSYNLEFREPPSLQLYVLLVAQEEYAKAFLLLLAHNGIIPFTKYIVRAMNDHACKQLVGMIIDYIAFRRDSWEEMQEKISADVALGDALPADVESAVLLLRYEKIGRWESRAWIWNDEPEYDPIVQKIADGRFDRRRQDLLYVRIGADGRVIGGLAPSEQEVEQEKERLSSFRYVIGSIMKSDEPGYRYKKTIAMIRDVFADRLAA